MLLRFQLIISISLGALLNDLAKIPNREHHRARNDYPTRRVFVRWVDELRHRFTPLPVGTTRSVFRLLFPEEDAQRKYGMQEKLLCSHLAQCISVPIEKIRRWDAKGASGCLGQELYEVLLTRSSMVILAHCLILFWLTIRPGRPEY